MTNLVYKKWLTTLLSIDYRHDNGDRRTNEVWSTGRNLAYGYDRAHQLLDVISSSRASDTASYRYDKAGNPIRRTEMGFGVTNGFNNLNQIVAGIWTASPVTVAALAEIPSVHLAGESSPVLLAEFPSPWHRRGNPQKSWVVGVTGLEPVTPSMSRKCSSQLSYTPMRDVARQ